MEMHNNEYGSVNAQFKNIYSAKNVSSTLYWDIWDNTHAINASPYLSHETNPGYPGNSDEYCMDTTYYGGC
jgi:hypothetical protein